MGERHLQGHESIQLRPLPPRHRGARQPAVRDLAQRTPRQVLHELLFKDDGLLELHRVGTFTTIDHLEEGVRIHASWLQTVRLRAECWHPDCLAAKQCRFKRREPAKWRRAQAPDLPLLPILAPLPACHHPLTSKCTCFTGEKTRLSDFPQKLTLV